MPGFAYADKSFDIDDRDYLTDFTAWDEDFARGMAARLGMSSELTKEQWAVINAIRGSFTETGRCPIVYETCRMCGLRLNDMKRLFPAGYLRGACRLAGITFREGYLGQAYLPRTAADLNVISASKTYRVDVRGFLIDPDDWDEYYAVFRAYDMKIPGGRLTDEHWQIIRYLRNSFAETGEVPTVYDTCEKNRIDLAELERLFPDGYHRGVVKIAGLRLR